MGRIRTSLAFLIVSEGIYNPVSATVSLGVLLNWRQFILLEPCGGTNVPKSCLKNPPEVFWSFAFASVRSSGFITWPTFDYSDGYQPMRYFSRNFNYYLRKIKCRVGTL